jgi:glycosyltransferase involved in cell wall biosynthesis
VPGYARPSGTAVGPRFLKLPFRVDILTFWSEWLAARSVGVIVHSRHAATMLQQRCPAACLEVIPMPIPVPALVPQADARRQLNVGDESYLLVVFGILNHSKNPIAILEAVGRLSTAGIPVKVVFIGRENGSFRLKAEVERLGLQEIVTGLDFVDDLAIVRHWLAAADVGLGLRSMYWGETSASTLRMLASGLPMIVNAVGAFDELPDAARLEDHPK